MCLQRCGVRCVLLHAGKWLVFVTRRLLYAARCVLMVAWCVLCVGCRNVMIALCCVAFAVSVAVCCVLCIVCRSHVDALCVLGFHVLRVARRALVGACCVYGVRCVLCVFLLRGVCWLLVDVCRVVCVVWRVKDVGWCCLLHAGGALAVAGCWPLFGERWGV